MPPAGPALGPLWWNSCRSLRRESKASDCCIRFWMWATVLSLWTPMVSSSRTVASAAAVTRRNSACLEAWCSWRICSSWVICACSASASRAARRRRASAELLLRKFTDPCACSVQFVLGLLKLPPELLQLRFRAFRVLFEARLFRGPCGVKLLVELFFPGPLRRQPRTVAPEDAFFPVRPEQWSRRAAWTACPNLSQANPAAAEPPRVCFEFLNGLAFHGRHFFQRLLHCCRKNFRRWSSGWRGLECLLLIFLFGDHFCSRRGSRRGRALRLLFLFLSCVRLRQRRRRFAFHRRGHRSAAVRRRGRRNRVREIEDAP